MKYNTNGELNMEFPTTPDDIRRRRDEIKARLTQHDAARKLIVSELQALQHVCQHPNLKTTSDNGSYGGPDFASTYRDCPDCGLHEAI